MGANLANIIDTNIKLTDKELKFIDEYMITGNGTQSVIAAGYKTKAPSRFASTLLRKSGIRVELQKRIKEREDKKTADRTEILQFYTSVMRGEQLDQFGIEASLDTRIKAANELAKHIIEIPLKLEQKNTQNNIGSIQINFVARE